MIAFRSAIRRNILVLLSFLVGLFLMFLPLPSVLPWLSPLWLVLILLYWVLMMPQYVNVGIAWCIGIVIDIVYNTTFGTHALILVLVAFFMIKTREKILPLNFWQMCPVIFALLVVYQLLLFVIQSYTGNYFNAWLIVVGAILGTLVWPLLAWMLFNCQKKFYL